jgi:hypothetical protein
MNESRKWECQVLCNGAPQSLEVLNNLKIIDLSMSNFDSFLSLVELVLKKRLLKNLLSLYGIEQ